MHAPKLTIELVPKTAWFTNVRSNVSKEAWDFLRRLTYKSAHYHCEICGGQGPNHPVEAHEVWEYDDDLHTQTLIRLIALCPDCHEVKHMGLANIRGRGVQAIAHLAKVNDWEYDFTQEYVNAQFDVWFDRSKKNWHLDISYLDQYRIQLKGHLDNQNIETMDEPLDEKQEVDSSNAIEDGGVTITPIEDIDAYLKKLNEGSNLGTSKLNNFISTVKSWFKVRS